jgi:CBS domain-containing protein
MAMKAADIMTRQVITAGPDESVVAIAAKMSDNRISAVRSPMPKAA